jgi:polysaccharide export outer membrane protein
MTNRSKHTPAAALALGALWISICGSGCAAIGPNPDLFLAASDMAGERVPSELDKVTLPPYLIEPPDILLIDAIEVIPKQPYSIHPRDTLEIIVPDNVTLPDQPINAIFAVDPSGQVNLGPVYGKVHVAELTVDEATEVIEEHLKQTIKNPTVSISLVDIAQKQEITGEHLVTPDGTVNLGTYGRVSVVGLTPDEARQAIEEHLSQFLELPEVSVDVYAYNSKFYYVITEGAGTGDRVDRFPVTGSETVLDAISQINGLEAVSSKRIWIARPAPDGSCVEQVLPVDWRAITKGGAAATNYQVLPGDRIFIAQDNLVAMDSFLGKLTSPVERMFGTTQLGTQTVYTLRRGARFGNNNFLGGGFF